MKFAVILLAVLAIACSAGSFVTQGQNYAFYAEQYGERMAGLILALHLDDAYHSWWFITITAFLCLNLIFCNLIRLPQLIRRTKLWGDAAGAGETADVKAEHIEDPGKLFTAMHMPAPKPAKNAAGQEILFSFKNRGGLWGAWICHLGILLLILGFGLGQMTKQEYTVYGVPGQTRAVGETGYLLTIDDFEVGLRADDTVEQYTSMVTMRSADGNGKESAAVSVNHPATLFGMRCYQNSTGWAAKVTVYENGELLQDEILCTGEYLTVKDKPDLQVYFTAFYPDYIFVDGAGPATASGQLKNPGYLYSVYYQGSVLGMNVLAADEELTIDDYTVTFTEPQNYTLIQIKKDPFTPLALVGGLVMLCGLVLAFYIRPVRMWAEKDEAGTYTVSGSCPKAGVIFREEFARAAAGAASEERAAQK